MPSKKWNNKKRSSKREVKAEHEPTSVSSSEFKGRYATFPKLKPPRNPYDITAAERIAIAKYFRSMAQNSVDHDLIDTPFASTGAAMTGKFNTIVIPDIQGTEGSTLRQQSEMNLLRALEQEDEQKLQIRRLFSEVWESMSEESKHRVTSGWPEYEEVEGEGNAAKLIQRVKQVHERSQPSNNPALDLMRSLRDLMTLKCSMNESFSLFVDRVRVLWMNHQLITQSHPFIDLPPDSATGERRYHYGTFRESVFVCAIAQAIPDARMPTFLRQYNESTSLGLSNHQLPNTIEEMLTLLNSKQ